MPSTLVPLAPDMSNIAAFVNSLFNADVRANSQVEADIRAGRHYSSFADANSATLVLNSWLAAWQKAQGDAHDATAFARCPATDAALIGFLASYIKSTGVDLCEPDLALTGIKTESTKVLATYQNNGYSRKAFFNGAAWNYGQLNSQGEIIAGSSAQSTVLTFLHRLMYGAHMVVVSDKDDLKGKSIASFKDAFTKQPFTTRRDPGNSHYTKTVNITGYYYLDIEKDTEPAGNPLLCAFLAASTSDNHNNTFIQLEGWQVTAWGLDLTKSSWHMKDFQSHDDTLWNYSTFGASVYSEKRCTPIFLATSDFSLKCDKSTKMPLYKGAGSKQNWMSLDLLELPKP